LAGHAGYGCCRSHSRFFWGFRLYLVTTAEGMPVTWCLTNEYFYPASAHNSVGVDMA
jgi:hypothetical protein